MLGANPRQGAWLAAALAVVALLASRDAAAQALNFAPVAGDAPVFYDGVNFRYQLRYNSATDFAQTMDVTLFDYLDITSIDCGAAPAFDATSLGQCGGGPPYTCAARICPGTSNISVQLLTVGASQKVQFVLPGGGTNADWPLLRLAVRMHASAGNLCGVPIVHAQDTSNADIPGSPVTDPAVDAACRNASRPGLVAVVATPANPLVGRAVTPAPVQFQLVGQLSDGTTVAQNAPITDPLVLAAATQCAVGANALAACSAASFTQAAQLTAVRSYPATFALTAVNTADPPAGDGRVVIQLPGMATPSTVPFRLEQNVASLQVAVAGGQTQSTPGVPTVFGVTTALNAAGGEEPRGATFAVVAATGVPLATAQGWLVSTDAQRATLTAPSPQSAEVQLTVRATHANPDGSTTTRDVPWRVQASPPPPPALATCFLMADETNLGPGEATTVRVMVRDANRDASNAVSVAPFAAQFSIETGQGTLSPDPNSAAAVRYTAGPLPGAVHLSAAFAAPTVCAETSASLTVDVTTDLRVQLSVDDKQVAPGGLVHVTAHLQNLGARRLDGVVFALRPSAALKTLQSLPTAAPGATVNAVSTARRDGMYFGAPLDPGTDATVLRLALLPRQSFACSTATASLVAYRDATLSTVIASSDVTVQLGCDPELSFATVFGRVFVDRNANGRSDADEPGLANVMVALSAGVYARTDALGRYHMARLQPGRQAIKVNPATLPTGASLPARLGSASAADGRAELTLTPGQFHRVNFAVHLPDLTASAGLVFVSRGSGIAVDAGRLRYRARFGLADHWSLVGVYGGDDAAAVIVGPEAGDARTWAVELALPTDRAHWLLVARSDDGRVELASFALYAVQGSGGGTQFNPWGPRSLVRLLSPDPQTPVTSEALTINGVVLDALTLRLASAGAACEPFKKPAVVAATFQCSLPLARQATGDPLALELSVDAGADAKGDDPPPLRWKQSLVVPAAVHFFVGLAGVEVGKVLPRIADAPALDWHAGGAFFYRGVIQGKVLITAGADAAVRDVLMGADGAWRSWAGVAATLLTHDARRVFRDLDPEAYYPVYGDASRTVDEREAGGRFFVRLQMDESYVKWGGVNTAIDDVEVGRYVRSMYGLGGRVVLGAPTDTLALRGVFFAAQPDSVAARDDFLVTGGALYFLAHRNVVEGALRATLVILDEISGLPLRTVPLQEGTDYEADHLGGRINLSQALPYRSAQGTITGRGTQGQTARLFVEYEYLPGGDVRRDWNLGGRAVTRLGPVSLGATAVSAMPTGGDGVLTGSAAYTLVASSATLNLGAPLAVRLEMGHSQGSSHAMASSHDGGLTFTAPVAAGVGGSAVMLEALSTLGAIESKAYGRYYEPGFTDSRTAAGQRRVQLGGRVGATTPWGMRLWGQGDRQDLTPPTGAARRADIALLGVTQRLGAWELSSEGRYDSVRAGAGAPPTRDALAAVRVGYDLTPRWQIFTRRRQIFWATPGVAEPRGETAVGAVVEAPDWRATGELGMNDARVGFGRVQGGMPLSADTDLYVGYVHALRLDPLLASEPEVSGSAVGNQIVVGGRQRLAGQGAFFAEQQLRVDGTDRALTRTVGGETALGRHLALTFSYARGALDGAPHDLARDTTQVTGRDAGSVGVIYSVGALSLRLGVDGRLDQWAGGQRAGGRTAQGGAQGRLELRPSDALTLAVAVHGGSTYEARSHATLQPGQAAWEGAVGFAFRPLDDWLSAFGRYALTHERRHDDAVGAAWLDATSHIAALSLVARVLGPWALSPKAAYRYSRYLSAGQATTDHALLVALRTDLQVSESWDVGLESRACGTPADDTPVRWGALAEASVLTMSWLRLGAGYNFSSVSVAGVQCAEPGARGAFVRAETVY